MGTTCSDLEKSKVPSERLIEKNAEPIVIETPSSREVTTVLRESSLSSRPKSLSVTERFSHTSLLPDAAQELLSKGLKNKEKFSNLLSQIESKDALLFPNNIKYQGSLSPTTGLREGVGQQIWPNNNYYLGDFSKDKMNGFGYLVTDKFFYEGEFLNDVIQGKGRSFSSEGREYEGEFKNNTADGQGVEKGGGEGAVYSGSFVNGVKQGKGRMEWENGCYYDGEFLNNKFEGSGEYKYSDGATYKGEFKENSMNGFGTFTWADGQKYEGFYKMDRKHGIGVLKSASGVTYEGPFENGVKHGQGKMTNKEGESKMVQFEKGKFVKYV